MSDESRPFNRPFERLGEGLARALKDRQQSPAGESPQRVPQPALRMNPSRPMMPPCPTTALWTDDRKPSSGMARGEDPATLFLREMSDVEPYHERHEFRRARRVSTELPPRDEQQEVVQQLDDLVSGRVDFDLSFCEEHVEGVALGVDRRLLKKLKKGGFSIRAELDLHGKTRLEAREVVERFLQNCRGRGHRCVLIVHGRGHHSADRIPVLKEALKTWLMRGRISRWVLAFCTAKPNDGGMGAVYVLLRK